MCYTKLFSWPFAVRYNMLLNLMRVEGANPEQMMALSFHQFQNEQSAPALEVLLAEKEAAKDAVVIADEPAVELYHNLNMQIDKCRVEMRDIVNHPKHIVPFLQPGRLVHVKVRGATWLRHGCWEGRAHVRPCGRAFLCVCSSGRSQGV